MAATENASAFDGDGFDLVAEAWREAVGDGGAGGFGVGEGFAVELVVEREVFGIADVIPGLDDVREVATGGGKHLAEVFHAATELALKGIADNVALRIDAGLPGDKDEITNDHAGTERQVRGGGVGELGVFGCHGRRE